MVRAGQSANCAPAAYVSATLPARAGSGYALEESVAMAVTFARSSAPIRLGFWAYLSTVAVLAGGRLAGVPVAPRSVKDSVSGTTPLSVAVFVGSWSEMSSHAVGWAPRPRYSR